MFCVAVFLTVVGALAAGAALLFALALGGALVGLAVLALCAVVFLVTLGAGLLPVLLPLLLLYWLLRPRRRAS